MDAIGFNGPVLKALSDEPDGPQLTVWTPPKEAPPRYPELFQSDAFVLNEAGDEVTCPQGEKTKTSYPDSKQHGRVYQFSTKQCRDCPLRAQCQAPGNRQGRRVSKNAFAAQYRAAQQRATTEEYKQIRKQHPAIERKLNELVRWHDGRRVRYRGRPRVRSAVPVTRRRRQLQTHRPPSVGCAQHAARMTCGQRQRCSVPQTLCEKSF